MVKLQKPKWVYMGGRLRGWDEAVLHVGCEAVTRGLNVFEGLKGYWQADSRFGIVMPRHHFERLQRSARLLHIPFETSYEQFEAALFDLSAVLLVPENDMWFRTTLFVTEGHWGDGTVADLVVTAYQADKERPQPIHLGVSTWRRSVDVALPPRIKTGSNYQVARLARIEGRGRGFDEMVLLNQEGRVAEATVACILMVRDGIVYTPPPTEGALESITIEAVEALAQSINVKFIRRPIDRTELLVADELAICGTITELTLAKSVDGFRLPARSRILQTLQDMYLEAVRGVRPHPLITCSMVPSVQPAGGVSMG